MNVTRRIATITADDRIEELALGVEADNVRMEDGSTLLGTINEFNSTLTQMGTGPFLPLSGGAMSGAISTPELTVRNLPIFKALEALATATGLATPFEGGVDKLLSRVRGMLSGSNPLELMGVTYENIHFAPLYLRSNFAGNGFAYADKWLALDIIAEFASSGPHVNESWYVLQYYLIHKAMPPDMNTAYVESLDYYWWANGGEPTAVTLDTSNPDDLTTLVDLIFRMEKNGNYKYVKPTAEQIEALMFKSGDGGGLIAKRDDLPRFESEMGEFDFELKIRNLVNDACAHSGNEYKPPTITWYQAQHYFITGQYVADEANIKSKEAVYWWRSLEQFGVTKLYELLALIAEYIESNDDTKLAAFMTGANMGSAGLKFKTKGARALAYMSNSTAQGVGLPRSKEIANLSKGNPDYYKDGKLRLTWYQFQYYFINQTLVDAKTAKEAAASTWTPPYYAEMLPAVITDVPSLLKAAQDANALDNPFALMELNTNMVNHAPLYLRKDFAGTEFTEDDLPQLRYCLAIIAANNGASLSQAQLQYLLVRQNDSQPPTTVDSVIAAFEQDRFYWWSNGASTGNAVALPATNPANVYSLMEAAFRAEFNGNMAALDNLTAAKLKEYRLIKSYTGTEMDIADLEWYSDETINEAKAALQSFVRTCITQEKYNPNEIPGQNYITWGQVQHYLITNQYVAKVNTPGILDYWWIEYDISPNNPENIEPLRTALHGFAAGDITDDEFGATITIELLSLLQLKRNGSGAGFTSNVQVTRFAIPHLKQLATAVDSQAVLTWRQIQYAIINDGAYVSTEDAGVYDWMPPCFA